MQINKLLVPKTDIVTYISTRLPSKRKSAKKQNKRHFILSQKKSATKDGAAHADSHFYHQKRFENCQEEHTWASPEDGQT